jgi:hypothetical protein
MPSRTLISVAWIGITSVERLQPSAASIEAEARIIAGRIWPGKNADHDYRLVFAKSFREFVDAHFPRGLQGVYADIKKTLIDTEAVERRLLSNPINTILSELRPKGSTVNLHLLVSWIIHDNELLEKYKNFCREENYDFCEVVGFYDVKLSASVPRKSFDQMFILEKEDWIKNIEQAISYIVELHGYEVKLDRLFRSKGSQKDASFTDMHKRKRIQALELFLSSLSDNHMHHFAEPLSQLYLVGHWADMRMHRSRREYAHIVQQVLRGKVDFANPSVVLLALEYAHNCKLFGDLHDRAWVFDQLRKLGPLSKERDACTLFKQRTDDLLSLTEDENAEQVIDMAEITTSIGEAYAWRCAACRTLAKGRIDKAVENAAKARIWFNKAAAEAGAELSQEDRMVPVYLDTIELIADVERRQKVTKNDVSCLNRILATSRSTDPRAVTLEAALYDLKARYILRHRLGNYEDVDSSHAVRFDDVDDLFRIAGLLLENATPDFCIFDMNDIRQRYQGT